jgi:hypothetical protein
MAHKEGRVHGVGEIRHFLITLDPTTDETHVREFGTDYDAAISAYGAAERADREGRLDIVLISSDSLATIEKTHSSYFTSASDWLAARR